MGKHFTQKSRRSSNYRGINNSGCTSSRGNSTMCSSTKICRGITAIGSASSGGSSSIGCSTRNSKGPSTWGGGAPPSEALQAEVGTLSVTAV